MAILTYIPWLTFLSLLTISYASNECLSTKTRTLSGKCTSTLNPVLGEARRALFSYYDVDSRHPDTKNLKSAREISNPISSQSGNTKNSMHLNELFTFFGQFIDHDFGLTPFAKPAVHMDIPVTQDDPILSSSHLSFSRSERAKVNDSTDVERPITVLSSALDLSGVYGVDEERNSFLRSPHSCRLRTSKKNLLPFNTQRFVNVPSVSPIFFIAGDTRANETPMLTAMHTIWVREHNRICDHLEDAFTNYSIDKQYEVARAINIAQFQKIVYEEWLPAILGAKLPRYKGYDENVNPTVSVEFTTAAFRLGHTLVGDGVSRIGRNGNRLPTKPAHEMFFEPGAQFTSRGMEDFIRGAAGTLAQEVDEKVVDTLRNFLFENVEEEEGFDLVALNLQRSRDHNVARFNKLREVFLGSSARSFADITRNTRIQKKLRQAYGSVENVEAWTGLMAEDKNRGVGVGRTLEGMLKTEFGRLRDGDQFFYLRKNQIPDEVLQEFPGMQRDIYNSRPLFNRILLRNTRISSVSLPRGANAFRN